MNNIFKITLVGVFAFAATPSLADSAVGTGPGGAMSEAAAQAQAAAAGDIRTYVPVYSMQSAGGDGTMTVPASVFTSVDKPKTLVCPGPKTCRIEADVWASLFNGSTANNRFGLCGFLDGQLMTQPGGGETVFGCPYTGTVPADGSLVAATQITAQTSIAPGSHTVQFKAYASGGATVGLYVAEYRLSSASKASTGGSSSSAQ